MLLFTKCVDVGSYFGTAIATAFFIFFCLITFLTFKADFGVCLTCPALEVAEDFLTFLRIAFLALELTAFDFFLCITLIFFCFFAALLPLLAAMIDLIRSLRLVQ